MTALFVFHSFKTYLGYFFGKHESVLENADKSHEYLQGVVSTYHIPFFHFIDSLNLLALIKNKEDQNYSKYIKCHNN